MADLPGITATVVAAGVSILVKRKEYADDSSWRFPESAGNGEWSLLPR
jgi:hypothetical protein